MIVSVDMWDSPVIDDDLDRFFEIFDLIELLCLAEDKEIQVDRKKIKQ